MMPPTAHDRRFHKELTDDVALARADRHADADFSCALGNGHEHDIHDADAADQKRDACDAAAEQRHQVARGLLLLLRLTVRVGAEIAAVYLAARLHELRERLFGERLDVLGIFGLDDVLMVVHAL